MSSDSADGTGRQWNQRAAGSAMPVPDAVRGTPGKFAGPIAGIVGGALVVRGLRRIRRGATLRGVTQVLAGGVLVAGAIGQRRVRRAASSVDQRDVVDTAPDVEDAVESGDAAEDHVGGDEAATVARSSVDVEDAAEPGEDFEEGETPSDEDVAAVGGSSVDVEDAVDEASADAADSSDADSGSAGEAGWSGTTSESTGGEERTDASGTEEPTDSADDDTDAARTDRAGADGSATTGTDTDVEEPGGTPGEQTQTEDAGYGVDRLGAAAFDDDSNSLPAPQRAFNQSFLGLDAEAVWGIRDDDAVVVSQSYDAIEEREDTRYVASSEVDGERMLRVPDDILDHWDELAEGITVESGTDLVFATDDDLADEGLLLVVPEQWAGDVLGEAA